MLQFNATSSEGGDLVTEAPVVAEQSRQTPRRAVFIVGSGRSGTSALACTLQALGMHVPQPEVAADATNPRGFGESQWVVDFHDRLLRRANVRVADSRPQAWFDTGKLSTNERHREEVLTWLQAQFSDGVREIVVKDPRLAWFAGLWHSATLRSGIESAYAVMLRPPTEVVGSKQKYYSQNVSEVSRAASWVNHMLHTERATRGSQRAFLRYFDLLEDWTVPIYDLGEAFDLEAVKNATAKDLRRVHDLIDPDLRRVRTTWDDVDLPKPLRAIVEETWHQLNELVDPDGDSPQAHAVLDQIRLEYTQLYEEAEAITQSTTLAARRKRPIDRGGDEAAPTPSERAAEDAVKPPGLPTPDDASPRGRVRTLLGRRLGT